jgi:hypothetical protein
MDSQLLYQTVTREVTVGSARLKTHKCRGRLDVVWPGDAARQYFLHQFLRIWTWDELNCIVPILEKIYITPRVYPSVLA